MNPLRWLVAAKDGLHSGERTSAGEFVPLGVEAASPLNYLAADFPGGRLYATARLELCAFDLAEARPRLRFKVPCMGEVACHLCLSPERRHLFCANYISGNVAVFRIGDDGFEFTQSMTGRGHCGSNRERQAGPHAHCCAFIDGNLWTVDLGQDAIFVYPWDGERLGEELHRIKFPSGTGPRHLVHDPVENVVYCVSELSCEWFVIDSTAMSIAARRPVAGPGDALSAVRLSPDGKTVGVGVRGADRIVFFDAATLEPRCRLSCGGRCVRDFDFADDETVCACCQESSSLAVFRRISEEEWRENQRFDVKKPMCVQFHSGVWAEQ